LLHTFTRCTTTYHCVTVYCTWSRSTDAFGFTLRTFFCGWFGAPRTLRHCGSRFAHRSARGSALRFRFTRFTPAYAFRICRLFCWRSPVLPGYLPTRLDYTLPLRFLRWFYHGLRRTRLLLVLPFYTGLLVLRFYGLRFAVRSRTPLGSPPLKVWTPTTTRFYWFTHLHTISVHFCPYTFVYVRSHILRCTLRLFRSLHTHYPVPVCFVYFTFYYRSFRLRSTLRCYTFVPTFTLLLLSIVVVVDRWVVVYYYYCHYSVKYSIVIVCVCVVFIIIIM